jgi:hypothetical protein
VADRDDQPEPKRVDSRGLPLAERPRAMLAGYVDAELVLAGQRAPVDSLEAELARLDAELDQPRTERRG